MEVFFYEHCQTMDDKFNAEYVRIYVGPSDLDFILLVHISNIIPLPDEVKIVRIGGANYPACDWRKAVVRKWETG